MYYILIYYVFDHKTWIFSSTQPNKNHVHPILINRHTGQKWQDHRSGGLSRSCRKIQPHRGVPHSSDGTLPHMANHAYAAGGCAG